MGHTPYGYQIENGIAIIDEDAARKLRKLYENYLSGLSLEDAAAKAGIDAYHRTVRRLLQTQHYIGDDFYPAIVDTAVFQKAQVELAQRAAAHVRKDRTPEGKTPIAPTVFTIRDIKKHFDNPMEQAEYIYSLIESEVS